MTRSRRPWQGLGLLLGLAGIVLFLSGQGCPMSPTPGGALDPIEESNTDQQQDSGSVVREDIGGPTAQVIFPNGGEQIEANTLVEVRVFARHPSIPDPLVRVFYDRDSSSANGNVTIGTIKASKGSIGWDLTGLGTGSYWIGAEIVGVTPAVIDYSDNFFQIVPAGQGGSGGNPDDGQTENEIMLSVTAPPNLITMFQGRVYKVRWSTNLLPGQGTATVFREPDFDEDNVPDGQALRDTIGSPGIDAALQTLDFDTTGAVGNFFIGVTVIDNAGRTATAYSQGTVKVLSPALWVGDLGTKRDAQGRVLPQTGPVQGAIFKGFNPYDNLGSAMIPADDYDGDGINEVVMAAQFAKPFAFAFDGRGSGEAYMIYGSRNRLRGDIEVNNAGAPSLPGLIFTGILPNPYGNKDISGKGNPYAYTVDGRETAGYETEGLRGLTLVPDQDGDGRQEIAFSFPWCDSYSLFHQSLDGINPTGINAEGRLENDGHFLRGGVVMVSSQNPLLTSRTRINRHKDRYMMLQEVGQVFSWGAIEFNELDLCPLWKFKEGAGVGSVFGGNDTVTYPCDGFWQDTLTLMDPPRLADPVPAYGMAIPSNDGFGCDTSERVVDLTQVDVPPVPTSELYFAARFRGEDTGATGYCDGVPPFAPFGQMYVLGTGFYIEDNASPSCGNAVWSTPFEPYGCRILGQTTTQLNTSPPTTANRFGASITTSGGFLVAGAPMRTPLKRDVTMMPELSRFEAGEVYLLDMRRQIAPNEYFWRLPDRVIDDDNDPTTPPVPAPAPYSDELPQPHNFIIDDVGYTRYTPACDISYHLGHVWDEISGPARIVGAAPSDRIGEQVNGLYDIDNDGVEDLAVGGPGTNTGRGGVYLLYRRQPGLEGDYLLERIQNGVQDKNGQYGLFIIGENGENLGTAVGGLGPRQFKDDYNGDGFSDLLIGSPNASPAAGFEAGEAFILFGGKRLSNPPGGITINQLRDAKAGMLLTGAQEGDRAGEVVAPAGDVNGDRIADLMISAPNATVPDIKFRNPGQDSLRSLRVAFQYDSNGDGTLDKTGIGIDRNGDGKADPLNDNNELDVNGNIIYDADDDLTDAGVVYVVFGGPHLKGTIKLDEIGTKALPGFVLVGRAAHNELGAGHTQNNLLSRGLNVAGDLDGDGRGDLMVSSVLADPDGRENAGEVYVMYGFAP